MREALARVDIPAFVAIFRMASGLSQLDLANLIPGWSQTLVCLTEKGTRCTLYDIRRFLAFTDLIGMPRTALLPLILGRPDAILECDADAAPQGAEDMDRREFSMLAAGLTAAALLPLPTQVDRGHVRYLQSTLVRLRTQDNVAGGGAVLPQALRHFAYARRLLDESDYSPTIGRELLADSAGDGAQRAPTWCSRAPPRRATPARRATPGKRCGSLSAPPTRPATSWPETSIRRSVMA